MNFVQTWLTHAGNKGNPPCGVRGVMPLSTTVLMLLNWGLSVCPPFQVKASCCSFTLIELGLHIQGESKTPWTLVHNGVFRLLRWGPISVTLKAKVSFKNLLKLCFSMNLSETLFTLCREKVKHTGEGSRAMSLVLGEH